VGLLTWLGLRQEDDYPNLNALLKELRRALPDSESVVLRYISVVVVLLGKVASADGRLSEKEEEALRNLLTHIERLDPHGVDAIYSTLRGKLPTVTDEEMSLCYRELKALCDGRERLEVLRLLHEIASVDHGEPSTAELTELEAIAAELGVRLSDLEPPAAEASEDEDDEVDDDEEDDEVDDDDDDEDDEDEENE